MHGLGGVVYKARLAIFFFLSIYHDSAAIMDDAVSQGFLQDSGVSNTQQ